MDVGHLNELIAAESDYWWTVAKRELALALLQRHCPPPGCLVEGGVGAGGNLLAFRDSGYDVIGLDILPEAVHHSRQRGVEDVSVHDLERAWPVPARSARAVVLLDVIEHLADATAALRGAAEALAPDGRLVVTVPAFPFLMGPWDRALGHHRRYTAALLRAQAGAAGLRIVWLSHWNAFSLPPAIVVRTWQKLFQRQQPPTFPRVAPALNSLLIRCARAERWLMHRVRIPCGLSLAGVLSR